MPGNTANTQDRPRTHPHRGWTPHALPAMARPGVLAFVWVTLLAYGSLLPFDLALSALFAHPAEGFRSLGLSASHSLSHVDLVTNLLLYVPLGVMLRIALRRRGLHPAAQIALGVLAVLLLSGGMEYLQAYSPSRVASLADVLANVGMGVVAVVFAPWLWAVTRRFMFWAYCRLSWPIHMLRVRMRFARRSPQAMLALVLLNATLLTTWYATQAANAWGPATASAQGDVALPFERHFATSYDTAALLLGRSLLVYAALGCLLSLSMLRGRAKPALRWVVVGVLLVSLGIELYRSRSTAGGFRADITEPLIALGAALLMGITTYLFAHAIRRSNRRRVQADYDGPERRRVRYAYSDKS